MAVYHEHMLEMISQRPYLWGTYVWNMFEFAAAGRDEAGDPGKITRDLSPLTEKRKRMLTIFTRHGGAMNRSFIFAEEDMQTV